MNLLEVKNLSVFYPKKQVVFDVNFGVKKGEFVAILGLNGSGKTTLLHGICGFLKSQGEVTVNGENVVKKNERERAKRISFIPQVSGLKDGFSVLDVVLMGYNPTLPFFAYPDEKMIERARGILSEVCPTVDENTDFSKLSQGQKQLVILARCIAQNAPLMVMDEPDSALDYNNRRKVLKIIKKGIESNGYAGLITMHDPTFALGYADRILILKEGRIRAEMIPKEATRGEIEEKLSLIYDNLAVWEMNGKFVVGEKNG